VWFEFFLVARSKVLILLRLRGIDRPPVRQNIGTKEVVPKILKHKGLAAQIRPAAFASDWF
jgi:hypothetical protein